MLIKNLSSFISTKLLTDTTIIAPSNGSGSISKRGVRNKSVNKIKKPAKILLMEVLAPACSAIAERVKLEETGNDWKKLPAILLAPTAINS